MNRITFWVKQLSIPVLACLLCLASGCALKQGANCGGKCCGSCPAPVNTWPGLEQIAGNLSTNADLPVLSEKEISELTHEWTDPGADKQLTLAIQFSQYLPVAVEGEKQPKSGGFQFIITGILTETRHIEGKAVARQITGDKVRICIIDSNGSVVVNTVQPLVKLCPVCGGGYIGEVTKGGEYSAVVWITNSMTGIIGQKVTATLK